MKKIYFLVVAMLVTTISFGQDLIITGVFDGPLTGGVPKGMEIYVVNNIADLSIYGVGSANNGGGSDGEEFTFPADAATAGDFIYVASEDVEFQNFFGFAPDYTTGAMAINGDDAIELFMNGGVIDIFGDIDVDGTGEPWEYLDGWAYRVSGTGPDGTNFVLANWTFSGIDAFDGATTNATAPIPFPLGTFTYTPPVDPTLTITSPNNGTVFNPEVTDVEIIFNVQNFNVATSGGDGHIHYTVDGGAVVMYYSTDPIMLTGLSAGSHTFYMELVDNSHVPIDPPVNDTVTFEIASYTDVADLATLRAGTEGEYYRVTGEAITSFTDGNKIWCQDATAGILIYNGNGNITTSYNEGDGITNLRGELSNFNLVLQLEPTADPGVNSTGNVITPEVITLAQLTGTKALSDYESELVKIHDVSITDISGGDGTFQANESYDIDDTTAASILRTAFTSADYIGTNLPSVAGDYTCIVGGYNGTAQVTPRDSDDILDVDQQNIIEGFSMYPNPVTNGMVYITTQNNLDKNIQIYDVLGKQIFAQTITGKMLDISNIKTGVYIINVEEAGHFATRKLVVE